MLSRTDKPRTRSLPRAARREPERYYLLPGMGKRARNDKIRKMLWWGLLGGLATSAFTGLLIFVINWLMDRM